MAVAKTYQEVLADVKSKAFKPLYLLHGEEPYFTDVLAKAFERDALDESTKGFNQTLLYGRETSAAQVVDASESLPDDGAVSAGARQGGTGPSRLQKTREVPRKAGARSTILVFVYRGKKLAGNTKVYKSIVQHGTVFESKPLYANQVPKFVADSFKARKRKLDTGVADLLAEYLGTDLVVLNGALDKLLLNVPTDRAVTPEDIETHVGISRQFNVFELQDALGGKDFDRAVRIGYALSQNERENPLPLTIAALFGFFAGMFAIRDVLQRSESEQKEATNIYSSFRLGKLRVSAGRWTRPEIMAAIEVLEEYDRKSKGVDYAMSSGGHDQLTLELLERLVGIGAGLLKDPARS